MSNPLFDHPMTLPDQPVPLQTRRIDRGRGHSYVLDGSPADGVTRLLNEGFPKPFLIDWAARVTREKAIDHWEELSHLSISERDKALSKARYEVSDPATKKGKEVHLIAQQLAQGYEVDVPEELAGHVDAYLAFTADWQPEEKLIEVVVVNRRYRYMGTLDLVAELKDGNTWLLDFKTGGKGVYSEAVLQVAAYRHAETYLGPDAQEHPMPKVDRCGVVWIRADGYDLYPVAADETEFTLFLYAQQIARWRAKQETDSAIGEALAR